MIPGYNLKDLNPAYVDENSIRDFFCYNKLVYQGFTIV